MLGAAGVASLGLSWATLGAAHAGAIAGRPVAPAITLTDVASAGSTATVEVAASAPAVDRRPGPAYWLAGAEGGVFAFARAAYAGALSTRSKNAPVVAVVATPSGHGYWLAGADGGVFGFGDALFYGAQPAAAHRAPIVAMARTPDGNGYWLASADGGVYAFGNAGYWGSAARLRLNGPIVAMASTPSGKGYWLIGVDGGVYAYGDALLYGSGATLSLNGPIAGMAPTPDGNGYWLVGRDGAIYAFGDAPYAGGMSGRHAPVVGIARTRSGNGYWLATADGGVFSFGDASYYGSVGGERLNGPMAAIASGDGTALPVTPTSPMSTGGYDVSWPQCDRDIPAPPYGFALVGVTDGHLFSANPCLRQQWGWATAHGSFGGVYVNTNAFTAADLQRFLSFEGALCLGDVGCALYQWGRQGAGDALRAAQGIPSPLWWLDVESGNVWLPDPAANAVILRGMIDQLKAAGKSVGIYSTSLMWSRIAGAFAPGLPTWVPGAADASWCQGHSFAGGPTWMIQSVPGDYDVDTLCAAGLAAYRQAFAAPAPLPVPEYSDTPKPVHASITPPLPRHSVLAANDSGLALSGPNEAPRAVGLPARGLPRPSGNDAGRWGVIGVAVAGLMVVGLGIAGARRHRDLVS